MMVNNAGEGMAPQGSLQMPGNQMGNGPSGKYNNQRPQMRGPPVPGKPMGQQMGGPPGQMQQKLAPGMNPGMSQMGQMGQQMMTGNLPPSGNMQNNGQKS